MKISAISPINKTRMQDRRRSTWVKPPAKQQDKTNTENENTDDKKHTDISTPGKFDRLC